MSFIVHPNGIVTEVKQRISKEEFAVASNGSSSKVFVDGKLLYICESQEYCYRIPLAAIRKIHTDWHNVKIDMACRETLFVQYSSIQTDSARRLAISLDCAQIGAALREYGYCVRFTQTATAPLRQSTDGGTSFVAACLIGVGMFICWMCENTFGIVKSLNVLNSPTYSSNFLVDTALLITSIVLFFAPAVAVFACFWLVTECLSRPKMAIKKTGSTSKKSGNA